MKCPQNLHKRLTAHDQLIISFSVAYLYSNELYNMHENNARNGKGDAKSYISDEKTQIPVR